MAKCPKCGKEFESCYLCRGQYPHQQCVDDAMCHECFMIENPNGRLGMTKKSKSVVKRLKHQNVYIRFGKKYRKIDRNEPIKKGAMQSWAGGDLQSIRDINVGCIPSQYSNERDFYNPIYIKEIIMKTKGLTFLEAVRALQSGKCEAIENENHMRYTVTTTGLTTLRGRKEVHKIIGLDTYLDTWSLIEPKPKTEARKLKYWLIVDNDGSVTITRTTPTSRERSTAQHVRECSFGYTYTFPD